MTMDLANNGLQLWDHIDDRVDRSRAQDEMEKVADDPYATTRSFISRNKSKQGKDGSVTTSGTDYNSQVNAVRENKLQELARPAQAALDEYASSGIDSMDPAEIVGGYGVALDPRNQYQNAVLNQFRKKQGTIDLLNKGNMAEAVVTDPVALKEYTESRKRAAETGEITQKSDYDSNLGSAAAWLAEQQGGEFAGLAPEEKARQLLAGFKLKPQDATNLLEAANIYKKTRNVEGGFGAGQDMQYTVDERTGKIVGTVGKPQDQQRRATRVSFNPVIQAFESRDAINRADEQGEIRSQGRKVGAMQQKIDNAFKDIDGGAYTGFGAGIKTIAAKGAGLVTGPSKKLSATENLDQNLKGLVNDVRAQGPKDGQMAIKEWERYDMMIGAPATTELALKNNLYRMKAMAEWKKDYAKIQTDAVQQFRGQDPTLIDQYIDEWAGANPIARYERAVRGARQQQLLEKTPKNQFPPPADFEGKTITQGSKRFKSNGTRWVPVR